MRFWPKCSGLLQGQRRCKHCGQNVGKVFGPVSSWYKNPLPLMTLSMYVVRLARPSKCVPHLGWSSKPGYNHTVQPTKLRANQLRMMHWTSTQGHTYIRAYAQGPDHCNVMLVAPLQWRVMHAHHLSILHWKPMIPSASIQQATKHIRKLLQYERVYTYVGIRFQT